jgi:hypothetical protein
MRAAQKLLSAPAIGVASAWAGGGGGESQRSQINTPPCSLIYMKTAKKLAVSRTFWLINS